MCTSLTLPLPDGSQLFGRTLDWSEHFGERVIRVPRGFRFDFGRRGFHGTASDLPRESRYAILGMSTVADGYPLFADGMNECGLCMAGLRFAKGAYYMPVTAATPAEVIELAPWELIPYVLGLSATLEEAREALSRVRVIDLDFPLGTGESVPNSPMHWHIADGKVEGGSLVLEATARGVMVYDAPLGVMANDPAYPEQLSLYTVEGELPGGYTSPARFGRAARLRSAVADALRARPDTVPPIARFFSLAAAVSPPLGVTPSALDDGWQTTLYTSCMDTGAGVYHYTTVEDPACRSVSFGDAEVLS